MCLIFLNIFLISFLFYKSRFDLQLEKWGLDVGVLKDIVITRNFIAWTKEWEKEKHKKYDTVASSKSFVCQKAQGSLLSITSTEWWWHRALYFIREEDIVWCCGRDGGWTIVGQCEDPEIEEDKITPLLAVTLICDTI